ncbi:EF-hand domain-containing protein [Cinnamomum micranthum f. kanehirae]|uniref:EF-hand domain-containing protein n=2 Tax=Lauraceae TaxID=3433 RepID=A0A3S3MGN4_9MAGN|nr:hypothetical protein MRB53_001412 [Persea americana]RWR79522.1 EF-hand domain-containing protein [Cinnamomum micranthum f. kanehirae]
MSVAILNGPTVKEFVEDEEGFNKCLEERFTSLDVNGDGVLSKSELSKGFEGFKLLDGDWGSPEEIATMFERFDTDRNGTVDLNEFKVQMKEIMLAVARGIGDSPIQVALDSSSLLMKAVQLEAAKNKN